MQREIRQSELANSLTHGIAAILAVAALVVLAVFAALRGTVWHVVSCSIYGSTLVLLFTASTLYHSLHSPGLKKMLRTADHSSIFLLIAGTYTPFTLATNLRGPWGWSLFGCVWGLALVGVILKLFYTGRFKILSTAIYLLMGWLVLVAGKPLYERVPHGAFYWLVAGGVLYTLGVVFYAWKKLPYSHAIWHLFVLAASICHFVAIMFYVVPLKIG